jgi:hypothetical protein
LPPDPDSEFNVRLCAPMPKVPPDSTRSVPTRSEPPMPSRRMRAFTVVVPV